MRVSYIGDRHPPPIAEPAPRHCARRSLHSRSAAAPASACPSAKPASKPAWRRRRRQPAPSSPAPTVVDRSIRPTGRPSAARLAGAPGTATPARLDQPGHRLDRHASRSPPRPQTRTASLCRPSPPRSTTPAASAATGAKPAQDRRPLAAPRHHRRRRDAFVSIARRPAGTRRANTHIAGFAGRFSRPPEPASLEPCAILTKCSASAGRPAKPRSSPPSASSPRSTIQTTTQTDPKAKERFAEANAAYEIVGDKAKRKQFDRGEIGADGKPRFQGFGPAVRGVRAERAATGTGRRQRAHVPLVERRRRRRRRSVLGRRHPQRHSRRLRRRAARRRPTACSARRGRRRARSR